jgi:hypothetical protein
MIFFALQSSFSFSLQVPLATSCFALDMDVKGGHAKSARARVFTWDRMGMTDTPFSRADPTVCEYARTDGASKPELEGNGTALFASPSLVHCIPHSIVIVRGESALGDDLLDACMVERQTGYHRKRLCTGAAGSCTLQFLETGATHTRSFVRTKEWVLLQVTLFGANYALEDKPTQLAVAPHELNPILLHNHLQLDERTEKVSTTRRFAYLRRAGLYWFDSTRASVTELEDAFRTFNSERHSAEIELAALSMFFYAAASHFHYYNDPAFTPALYDYFIERVYHTKPPRRVVPSDLYKFVLQRQASCFDEMEEKADQVREILREWREKNVERGCQLADGLSGVHKFRELAAVLNFAQCLKVASVSIDRRVGAPRTVGASPRRIGGSIIELEDVYSALLKGQFSEIERVKAFTNGRDSLTCLEFSDSRVDEAILRRTLDSQLAFVSGVEKRYVLVRYIRGNSHTLPCVILPTDLLRACNLVVECIRRLGRSYPDGQKPYSLAAPVAAACCQTSSVALQAAADTCLALLDEKKLPRRTIQRDAPSISSESKTAMTHTQRLAWSSITRRINRYETGNGDAEPLSPPTHDQPCFPLAVETRTPTGSPFAILTDVDSLSVVVEPAFHFSMTKSEVQHHVQQRHQLSSSRFMQNCLSRWRAQTSTSFEYWPATRSKYGVDPLPPSMIIRIRSHAQDAKSELEADEQRRREHELELKEERDLAAEQLKPKVGPVRVAVEVAPVTTFQFPGRGDDFFKWGEM